MSPLLTSPATTQKNSYNTQKIGQGLLLTGLSGASINNQYIPDFFFKKHKEQLIVPFIGKQSKNPHQHANQHRMMKEIICLQMKKPHDDQEFYMRTL